jgi:hypothetical protein
MEDLPRNRTIAFIALTVVACFILIALIVSVVMKADGSVTTALGVALGGILTLLGILLRAWKPTSE